MINFPASPTSGQLFLPPGGVVYRWDGSAWTTQAPSLDNKIIYTDGTVPMQAQLKLVTPPVATNDAASKAYVDGGISYNVAQSLTNAQQLQSRQNAGVAPYDPMAFNNMVVNGSMQISQENGFAAISNIQNVGKYVADNWVAASVGGQIVTAQNMTDSSNPPGFSNSAKITVSQNATQAAGDYCGFYSNIEGYKVAKVAFNTAQASPVTLAFWVRAVKKATYGGALRTYTTPYRAYPFLFNINNASLWEYKTITIPGDTITSGSYWTNGNAGSFCLWIMLATGTTYSGPANAWATANYINAIGATNGVATLGDYMQITGVTLTPGSDAPQDYRSPALVRPYSEDLLACKRYFYNGVPPLRGAVIGSSTSRMNCWHPVTMRTVPTVTATVAIPVYDPTAGTSTFTTISNNFSTIDVLEINTSLAAALGTYKRIMVYQGAGGNLVVDSRM